MPAYWLMKSEPDELSIRDLQRLGTARWDGVRNYQARNFIRSMNPGDLFFFYHSSCPQPGIAGIARIEGEAYPDPTALDPASPYHDPKASAEKNPWSARDVSFVEAFAEVVPLARLKAQDALANLALVQKGSRLGDAGQRRGMAGDPAAGETLKPSLRPSARWSGGNARARRRRTPNRSPRCRRTAARRCRNRRRGTGSPGPG